jgi:hypothetical protein
LRNSNWNWPLDCNGGSTPDLVGKLSKKLFIRINSFDCEMMAVAFADADNKETTVGVCKRARATLVRFLASGRFNLKSWRSPSDWPESASSCTRSNDQSLRIDGINFRILFRARIVHGVEQPREQETTRTLSIFLMSRSAIAPLAAAALVPLAIAGARIVSSASAQPYPNPRRAALPRLSIRG